MPGAISVDDVVLEHISYLDQRVAIFRADMTSIAQAWRRLITDELLGNDYRARTTAEQISQMSRELIGQLNRLGYYDVAADFMTAYQESERFARSLAQLTGPLGDVNAIMGATPLPSNLVTALKSFDYSAFTSEIGPGAARVIAREMVMSAVTGKKRSDVLASVESQIGSFTDNASSYADTALRTADRVISMEVWDEAGIDRFKYFGPADNRNREFCRSHVGRTYDLSAIKAMRNGSGRWGDVLRYGGGIRCRHVWSPVVSEPSPREESTGPSWEDRLRAERDRIREERKRLRKLPNWNKPDYPI